MRVRLWSILALTLAALSLGPSFAHVLEAAPRIRDWPPQLWIDATVLHGQFAFYRLIGGPIDVGAVIATVALAAAARGTPAFRGAVAAAILLTLALVAWFALVAPVNTILATWADGAAPDDFVEVRNRWESGHMAVAALKLTGFIALAAAVSAPRSAPAP